MPTTEDLALVTKVKRDLATKSYSFQFLDETAPKAQWWKPDGTPLANKLPADAYHIRRYQARGWTLYEPPNPVAVKPQPVVGVASGAPATVAEARNGADKTHTHRYGKTMGSPCRTAGCSTVRTTAFKKRNR